MVDAGGDARLIGDPVQFHGTKPSSYTADQSRERSCKRAKTINGPLGRAWLLPLASGCGGVTRTLHRVFSFGGDIGSAGTAATIRATTQPGCSCGISRSNNNVNT